VLSDMRDLFQPALAFETAEFFDVTTARALTSNGRGLARRGPKSQGLTPAFCDGAPKARV
jgi:hypothetical protein